MDPRERLRIALLGAGCTSCGRPYAAPGIKVLAQREEIAFVQLICFTCQTQTLALVTGVSAAGEGSLAEDGGILGRFLPDDEEGPAGPHDQSMRSIPPISDADVLEMRAFLADYQGDIRGLLDPSAEDDAPNGGDDPGHAG